MMRGPLQSILVPIVHALPQSLLSFAELFSNAYGKPLSFLFFDKTLYEQEKSTTHYAQYCDLSLSEGIKNATDEQDNVMLIWHNDRRSKHLQNALTVCRDLRIPYFFVPNNPISFNLKKVLIPVTFLIEDREKGVWARSLSRVFDVHFTLLKPKDKGSRAQTNVKHISDFLHKNKVEHNITQGRKSSFNINLEATLLTSIDFDLLMITASREYGLDDLIFGPKERRVIAKSSIPIMVLNPRDDLYVLCGD